MLFFVVNQKIVQNPTVSLLLRVTMRSRDNLKGKKGRRNRRASSVPSGAIASSGKAGVEINV